MRMGKPDSDTQEQFTAIHIQGVTIWKSADIDADKSMDGIQIGLSKFFIFKSLTIEGAIAQITCEERKDN